MDELDQSQPCIRPARGVDFDAVLNLIEPFIERSKILPRTVDELQQLMPNGFVAEWDGALVGFAALEVYSKKLAEVRSLAVVDAWQGRGVGRRLVEACLARARELEILEVLAISSAENFFLACGFGFTLPGEKKAFFFQTRQPPEGGNSR